MASPPRQLPQEEEEEKKTILTECNNNIIISYGGSNSKNSKNSKNKSNDYNNTEHYQVYSSLSTTTTPASFAQVFLPTYKVIVIGDSGVGKSNLLSRFTHNYFDIHIPSTIGIEFTSREVEVPSIHVGQTERIIIQLWDTAGQERCHSISLTFFRGAVGAIYVYDITQRETLLHLPMWSSYIQQYASKDCVGIMLGNKIDLQDLCQVSRDEGEDIAHRLGMRHFMVSARNGEGVSHAFLQLILALSAVQQVKRYEILGEEEKEKGGEIRMGSTTVSLSSRYVRNGILCSAPPFTFSSSSTTTTSPSSLLPRAVMKGQQMDLQGFGNKEMYDAMTSKQSSKSCCV